MTVLHRLIYSLNIASECGSPAAVYLASFAGIVYSAGDQPQVTIPNLPFTIYQPQFTRHHLPATSYKAQFISHNLPFTIYQPQFTRHNLPTTIDKAQFISHNLPVKIYQPQFTRHKLPVTIYQPHRTINNSLATITSHNSPETIHHNLSGTIDQY